MTGIMLVLMLVTGYVTTDRYVESITNAVVEKLLVQARSYSRPAGKHILAGNSPDVLMLSNVCKNLAADNKDVFWAGIAGNDSVFLAHTDIKQAPWHVVNSDIKKHARLNCISHLLSLIDYEDLTPGDIELSERPTEWVGYVRPPMEDQSFVPEIY